MMKFNDLIALIEGKKVPFQLTWFKCKKRKILKEEFYKYGYEKAFNFGLFYIGYHGKNHVNKYVIDFSSNLGNLRFIRLLKKVKE